MGAGPELLDFGFFRFQLGFCGVLWFNVCAGKGRSSQYRAEPATTLSYKFHGVAPLWDVFAAHDLSYKFPGHNITAGCKYSPDPNILKSYRVLDSDRIAPNKGAAHPFDLRWGPPIRAAYLGAAAARCSTGHAHDAFCYGYSAIAPSVFDEALRRWRGSLAGGARQAPGRPAYSSSPWGISAPGPRGARALALLLASLQLPFRKVIGVEFSAPLAAIARNNVARWGARYAPAGAGCACFSRTRWGVSGPGREHGPSLLVYLYKSIPLRNCASRCWSGWKRWAPWQRARRGVERCRSRTVDILYVNPVCADVSRRPAVFRSLWTGAPSQISISMRRIQGGGTCMRTTVRSSVCVTGFREGRCRGPR